MSWIALAGQRVALVQDTEVRLLAAVPAGWGVASICQLVPFHASATVWLAPCCDAEELPTAMHQEAVLQETLARLLL